jgi:hypothetical protein
MERKEATMKRLSVAALCVILPGLLFGAVSCQTLKSVIGPKAKLEVIPSETFLSPALIKKPVTFKGTGFEPNEMFTVEMILPPGVTVKGVEEGADVGIAYGTADKDGNFTAAMHPIATLNWFFQVGWEPTIKPNFKEAKPLPPGEYKIRATGLTSYKEAVATFKIVPPPKKK